MGTWWRLQCRRQSLSKHQAEHYHRVTARCVHVPVDNSVAVGAPLQLVPLLAPLIREGLELAAPAGAADLRGQPLRH